MMKRRYNSSAPQSEVNAATTHLLLTLMKKVRSMPSQRHALVSLACYGRYLKDDRSREAYKYALDSLQKGKFNSWEDTHMSRQLLYIYDKMGDDAQEAFLDICVLMYRWKWDVVASIVGEIIFKKLGYIALVKKNELDQVILHDVLRLMGRNKAEGTRMQSMEELSKVLEKGCEAMTTLLERSIYFGNGTTVEKACQLNNCRTYWFFFLHGEHLCDNNSRARKKSMSLYCIQ
eukprot:Gb_28355 [translate_table: standard]